MRAARVAGKLLEHLRDLDFPFPVIEACYCLNIELRFADIGELDGIYLRNPKSGHTLIIVNDTRNGERQRFSAAHELGHALMHHPPLAFLKGRKWGEREPWQEAEANRFASEFLMPAPFLFAHGLDSPEKIAEACYVSLEAARIRAGQLGWA